MLGMPVLGLAIETRVNMQPIKILGAGPAGLTAAITLARAGREVVVFERAANVGSRRDGDLEALENFMQPDDVLQELAGWGIAADFHYTPLYGITCFGPGFRESVHVEDSTPLMYFTRRGPEDGSLDRALYAQACRAGAQVLLNRAVKPEQVDIVAGGLARPRAFAVGYNFQTDAPNAAYVLLDRELAPRAYAYVVLCDGRGTLATCTVVPQPAMRERLARVVAGFRSRVRFTMREPRYFAASVTFGLPRTARRDGRLYVGEAVPFQDVWTGFGMRIGMASGNLAARCLLDPGLDYDALWHARLDGLMQAAAANRFLQTLLGDWGYPLVQVVARRNARRARAMLHHYYNPTKYSRLLWSLARRAL